MEPARNIASVTTSSMPGGTGSHQGVQRPGGSTSTTASHQTISNTNIDTGNELSMENILQSFLQGDAQFFTDSLDQFGVGFGLTADPFTMPWSDPFSADGSSTVPTQVQGQHFTGDQDFTAATQQGRKASRALNEYF